ncbi:MAG TPA: hypothetical protein VMF06_23190 [Candidatus Limnocylindria bacterium]|jgi:hypothetical protein|nr:hypothetical protein [Candidatus Limnocylindria bacterium]
MQDITQIVSSHVYYALVGQTLTQPTLATKDASISGTPTLVDRLVKPGTTNGIITETVWRKFARVKTVDWSPGNGEAILDEDPMPGQIVPVDVHRVGRSPKIKLQLQTFGPLLMQLLMGTTLLDQNSAAFQQFSDIGAVKGWFKFQKYRSTNEAIFTADVFGEITLSEDVSMEGKKKIEPKVEILCLYTPLLAGSLL